MPFTLEILFSGLIAFVPVGSGSQPDYVWALMLDGQNPPRDSDKIMIDSHFAVIRYHTKNLAHGVGQLGYSCKIASPDLRAYYISGSEITLPGLIDGDLYVDPSFEDLISLTEVIGDDDSPIPRSGYFGADPPVASRLKIEHGTLRRYKLDNYGLPVRFKPPMNFTPRKVARDMILTFEGLEGPVEIKPKPFDPSAFMPSLILLPYQDETTIRIEIMNSPEELIRTNSHEMRSERHFELFWDLVGFTSDILPAPYPVQLRRQSHRKLGPEADADLLCPEIRP